MRVDKEKYTTGQDLYHRLCDMRLYIVQKKKKNRSQVTFINKLMMWSTQSVKSPGRCPQDAAATINVLPDPKDHSSFDTHFSFCQWNHVSAKN